MYWPRLATECKAFVRVCAVCQCAKRSTKKYGHLPAKSAEVVPWDQLCVDLVGPLTVTIDRKKDRSHTLKAMTFIDPATGWFEIAEIDAKDSASISQKLDLVWLSRYLRPHTIIFDNGSEFKKKSVIFFGIMALGLN